MEPAVVEFIAHAAAIAALIRGVVAALKSPLLAKLPFLGAWHRISKEARVLILLVLTGLAGLLDALATGQPFGPAFLAALTGLLGAVGSHEMQSRVVKPKKVPAHGQS